MNSLHGIFPRFSGSVMDEMVKMGKTVFTSVRPLSNCEKLFVRPVRAVVFYHNAFLQHIRNCEPLQLLPINTDNVFVAVCDSQIRVFVFVFILFFFKTEILKYLFINLLLFKIQSVVHTNPSQKSIN